MRAANFLYILPVQEINNNIRLVFRMLERC